MRQLPPSVWAAIAIVALVLCALCVGTLAATLRAPARRQIARWPAAFLLELVSLAIVPWLIVVYAPITIKVSIHGLAPLIGWILLALLAFGLLVLLPLAAAASGLVWWTGRRRRRALPAEAPPREPPL